MSKVHDPDRIRIEDMADWRRAFREDLCDICGCLYWKHQPVSGYEWLYRLCDGSLVKL